MWQGQIHNFSKGGGGGLGVAQESKETIVTFTKDFCFEKKIFSLKAAKKTKIDKIFISILIHYFQRACDEETHIFFSFAYSSL